MHNNYRDTKITLRAIGALASLPRRYQGVSASSEQPATSHTEAGALRDAVVGKAPTRNPDMAAQRIGNAQMVQNGRSQITPRRRTLRSPANRTAADLQRTLQHQATLTAIISHGMTYTVQFRNDSAHLAPHYQDDLKQLAQSLAVLRDLPFSLTVHLTGHADRDSYNLELSQRRVAVVRAYLLHTGLSDACIECHAVDEQGATAKQSSAGGRFLDQRVHLSVCLAAVSIYVTTHTLNDISLPLSSEITS